MMGIEMMEETKLLVESSIKNQNPQLSALDLKIAVFKRYYSNDFDEIEMNNIVASITKYNNSLNK
jgi:hypothetical protein